MTLEEVKYLAEIGALISAGLFFLYKLMYGYFKVNLTMEINCNRQASETPNHDLLAVNVSLIKGDRGSLQFHDASVKVNYNGKEEEVHLAGIERSSYRPRTDVDGGFKEVNWSRRSKKSPFLRLTPGEKTHLTAMCLVPNNKGCIVEAVVLGKRTKGCKIAQWKTSCVSLPRNEGITSG